MWGTVSKIVRRSQAMPDSLAYLRQRQQIVYMYSLLLDIETIPR